jgi:3-isopropylmalate dehydrogenase
MTATKKILLLPGDGIGPEITAAARKVMNWFQQAGRTSFEVTEDLIGGASYDVHGTPLSEATLKRAQASDAVIMASVGGPKWDKVPYKDRPEAGLLAMRKGLGVFANLRPAVVFDVLANASTLKPEVVKDLDIMIVRELLGGVYFGEPRGIETLPNGERRAINTQVYTTSEIQRVARVAFELARLRKKKLCSVEKANVMESGVLWREEVTKLHAEYQDVALVHMYADNCAMQLVRNPKQFDVILSDNLFGDILSDLASMLPGSLGMLPSASLGARDASGRQPAFYEPIHGSAPDIAGKGIANPLAMILSYGMMLRYSFDMGANADLLEKAVQNVLRAGVRTADIVEKGQTPVSTQAMGEAVIKELTQLAAP